ncbi:MAG TPA: invasin domain 3-containing protein [Solirubrobacteraceae bacterium]|nr:invasin domain 3-containing protein [Solirubrobacteraceae bacterium]
MTLSLSPMSITANGSSTSTATVTVDDSTGAGVTGDTVDISSTDNGEKISPTPATDNGNGTYTATITSSTTPGMPMITATDTTSPVTPATETLTQTADSPATVTVSLNPTSIVANGTATTTATATVKDADGVLLSNEPDVGFSSSDGGDKVSTTTNAGNGTYTATITSSTTAGTPTITATDGNASGGATLTETADPPATVTVALNPTSIVANGIATTTATATVKDAGGTLLSNESNVKFSSSDTGEKVSTTTNAGSGTYTATITSSTTAGTPTITATDGTVSGTAVLTQTADPPATVTVVLNPTSIIANGTATTIATATVKDAEGTLLANETAVTFKSSDTGDKVSTTTNAGSGTYTATITSSTTVGTPTITATDGTVSGTATLTQTVGAASAVTVVVSPAVILANGTSTATATATVKDAEGHLLTGQAVSFKSTDSGQFFGQVSDNGNGTYSVPVRSSTTVGSATITATDSSVSPAIAGQGTLVQAAGPSTTSLVASSSSLVTNQIVTLFATVNPGSGSPAGAITFDDGGAPIANCVAMPITPSNPGATCQTSFAASTSPERLTAVFVPNTSSTAPGSTGTATITVTPDSTSVSLNVSTAVNVGQSTTYTATVAPPASRPGPVEPSGSVEFFDNGSPIASCLNQTLVNLSASCTLTYSAVGMHSITARYSGDPNFTASTASAQPVSVALAAVHVIGLISATMQWTFDYTPTSTKVAVLLVNWVSSDATVLVKCHGRGCPFATHTSRVAKPKRCGKKGKPKCPVGGSINLAGPFQKDPLHPRTTVIVTIKRPGWVGKYYKFTIRAGNNPVVQISCLAPGGTRPGVGC